jgi:hypothetical protein
MNLWLWFQLDQIQVRLQLYVPGIQRRETSWILFLSLQASSLSSRPADRIIELLSKVRQLREAPSEVHALINELSDLKVVLGDLDMTAREIGNDILVERRTNLESTIENTRGKVFEVEFLMNHEILKLSQDNSSRPAKVNRIAWTRRRMKVEKMRQDLGDLRLTLVLQLVALTS